jgi:hypothetical protein
MGDMYSDKAKLDLRASRNALAPGRVYRWR